VAELLRLAEQADAADVPDGMSVPEELARREERLVALALAKAQIEARAAERYEREKALYEQKIASVRPKRRRVAGSPVVNHPHARSGPRPDDQVNLTDPDSRIMPCPMAASSKP